MAAPFGAAPTLGQYMKWLAECGGHSQCGFKGRASLIKMMTAEGRIVVVTDIAQTERLVPTMVAYLDRRLGVKSPWHLDR